MIKLSVAYASLIVFGLLFGCNSERQAPLGLPYYNSPDLTPLWPQETVITDYHTIDTFRFTNQEGRTIGNESLKGKIYVASFFFTSCGSICPQMTASMHKVQEAYQGDTALQLLSFTVTPWIDTPERLLVYAQKHDVDAAQWQLLRSTKARTYNLARQSFFAEGTIGVSKGPDEFLHTENFILVDGQGHIRGIYNGTLALDMNRLISDIKTLKTKG